MRGADQVAFANPLSPPIQYYCIEILFSITEHRVFYAPGRVNERMDRYTVAGSAFLVVGLLAYAAGVSAAYPGRAFSLTAVMVGVSLVVIPQPSAGDAR